MSIAGLPTTPMINARSASAGAACHPSSSVHSRPAFRFGRSTEAGVDALSWRRPEAASGATPSTSGAVTAFKQLRNGTFRLPRTGQALPPLESQPLDSSPDAASRLLLDWLAEYDKPGGRLSQDASRQLTRVSALLYRSLFRMSGDPASVVEDGADADSAHAGFQALEDVRAAGLLSREQFDVLRNDFASRVSGKPAKEVASASPIHCANPSRKLRTASPPQAAPAHGHAPLVAKERLPTGSDRGGSAVASARSVQPSNVVGRIQQAFRQFVRRL